MPLRFLVVLIVFALCIPAEAQQAKVPRIGYLSPTDAARESTCAEVIRLALRERGYIEGQNIAVEYRYTEGKVDGAPELAAELVRLRVDLIVVAGGDSWIRAAKNATTTIPIIMMGSGSDPVEAGLVENLARPGGNVTGLTLLTGELSISAYMLDAKGSYFSEYRELLLSQFASSGKRPQYSAV